MACSVILDGRNLHVLSRVASEVVGKNSRDVMLFYQGLEVVLSIFVAVSSSSIEMDKVSLCTANAQKYLADPVFLYDLKKRDISSIHGMFTIFEELSYLSVYVTEQYCIGQHMLFQVVRPRILPSFVLFLEHEVVYIFVMSFDSEKEDSGKIAFSIVLYVKGCIVLWNFLIIQIMNPRQEAFQENINKRVLLDWVRIVGLENPHRKTYDRVLADFAHNILKYPSDKPLPFSWPTGAGVFKGIPAIRARISYDCWRYFLSEGRNHLSTYNATNKKDIRIIKEQTMKVSDEEKLGLYIRKFIRDVHSACRRRCPDVVLKKGLLHIGKEFSFTPAMTAYRFNINLQDWHGLPLEEMFTAAEKEAIAKGEIERGGLRLTGVNLTKPLVHSEEIEEGPERKRPRTEEDSDPTNQAGPSKEL